MAIIRGSALILLTCCLPLCLAEGTFSGALLGVVILVALVLTTIIAVAVGLLILWMKWQRQEKEGSTEYLQEESSYDRREEEEKDEATGEEGYTEPPTQLPPVYATVNKTNPRVTPPVDSFTNEVYTGAYSLNGASGKPPEDQYDDIMLKPLRQAPPAPTKVEETKERQEMSAMRDEDQSKTKSARRPPPPKPKAVGEEGTTATMTPSQEEEEQPAALPFKLPPLVPQEKLRSTGPPAPPTKPYTAGPPAPPTKPVAPTPPTKPHSTGPPAPPIKPVAPTPPTKPHSTGPPAPPAKPGPPAPPTKPGAPTPPEKPHSKGPPMAPYKPTSSVPGTKPKPQPPAKPVGAVLNSSSDRDAPSPAVAAKPSIKPRVPTKPSSIEEDASTSVPVSKFGEHVASFHSDGNTGFSQQYDSLPTGEFGQAIFDAILPVNACRNRHPNILPYNDSRPKLHPVPGNKECQHNYINASYINGLSSPHKYIAAQGPKRVTVIDFWRMIWQEEVVTIAMVTALREGSDSMCERYWPEFGTVQYGPYLVLLTEQHVLANYTISTLELHLDTDTLVKPRTIKHVHFTAWQDNDSPQQAGPLLSYLRRINSLHNQSMGPLLVHCSAGVGRTGSLLAIDFALEQARKEGRVDIPAIVSSLRRQRMKMVQSQKQYMFIHDAVLEQLVCGDTEIPTQDFNRALLKLQQTELKDGVFKTGFGLQFDVLEQVSAKADDVLCQRATLFPDKNRSTSYLPPDNRRVVLQGSSDYIHASFADGYRQKNTFIIAQAPLEGTCKDFWKMVYERECGVIVMLSTPIEMGQLCAQYWSEETDGFDRQYGELSIRTVQFQRMSACAIHTMTVKNRRTGKQREVVQFQVTTWTDDNISSSPPSLVEAIHHIRAAQRKSANKSIIVHGIDTVSRCGIVCALMNIIDQCMVEGVVDVFQAVKVLRLHKPGSVTTLDQYQSLYHLMTVYLDSFDTYANFK